MPKQPISESARLIATYNGSHGKLGPCSTEQWGEIAPVFRTALAPLAAGPVKNVRLTATPFVRLCVFALGQGIDIELAILLQPALVEAFLATLSAGTPDARSALRKLAQAHGLPVGDTPLGYVKRNPQDPYSDDEIDALLFCAETLSTLERRVSFRALVVLGAGAGLSRSDLRDVEASSFHRHDDRMFVAAGGRCALLLERFVPIAAEICVARPEGWLLGNHNTKNITDRIVEWGKNKAGIPPLSPDRLRATYITASLDLLFSAKATFPEVLAWTGVAVATLTPYLERMPALEIVCDHATKADSK